MKCDKCDQPATVHLIEIVNGKKIEKHLCEKHAIEDGVTVKMTAAPINELLEKFVMKHTGEEEVTSETVCGNCGMTWDLFRKRGLLGCPACYETFESNLQPLLERAHEGANRHVGKAPSCAGTDELRQQRLMQLRRELDQAVASEQYERAAALRDEVDNLERDKQ